MNSKKNLFAILLIALFVASVFSVSQVSAKTATTDLLIKIFYDPTAENWALDKNDIDINDWPLSKDFIDKWSAAGSGVSLNEYAELGKMEFDMNDQWWPTGPNDPTHSSIAPRKIYYVPGAARDTAALYFRRAIAHLTHKSKYITDYLKGQGYAMETEVMYPALAGYIDYGTLTNDTAVADYPNGPGYLYLYSRDRAIEALRLGGFEDFDHDTVIEWNKKYPAAWTGPGDTEELPPFKLWSRIDDPNRRQAGEDLAAEMDAVGIKKAPVGPLVVIVTERSACFNAAMVTYDYNLYTGGWDLNADLDYIHDLYGGEFGQYANAPNYPGFLNEEFDYWADAIKYAPTEADVKPAAINAQWVKAKYIPTVELWASKAVKAYRTGWEGVVNEEGGGIDQTWSFHEMDWTGGGTDRDVIRYGFKSDISAISVLSSEWLWDWNVLDNLYDTMLLRNPYDLAEEVGALATEWSIGSWGSPAKTVINFKMRDNAKFSDGSPIKPADVAFSLLLVRDAGQGVAWNYATLMDLDHVTISGQDISVYFGVQSFWALHWAGFSAVFNKDLWYDALGVPGVYIKQYDRNSQGFILGANGYSTSGFIEDDKEGTYSGGTFAVSPPLGAKDYRPWTDDRGGAAGVIDLQEDCSNMWKFVSYTIGNTVHLTRNDYYYTTSTSGVTRKAHDDWICPTDSQLVGIKSRPWLTPTPAAYKTLGYARFLSEAFHERGNVNYPGAYGSHTHTSWYAVDKIINTEDLRSIGTSAPSIAGYDTTLWPEANWGNLLNKYNIDADVTGDQLVDVEDLSLAGVNFMKKEG